MTTALLAWPGAIAIGVSLGLLGSGGSILTVPVLLYFFGQDEKVAIAGSLAIVGLIALAGSMPYILKRQIDWRSVLWFGLPGMLGTYAGAFISQYVSGLVQLSLFALVMLTASYFMFKPPALKHPDAERHYFKIVIDGLLVGVLTGFVGVGGGFLIVPALVLLGGLSMRIAVGTSLFVIAIKSFSGFYKYVEVLEQQNLALDWDVILLVTLLGILGSFMGNFVGAKVPQDKLRRGFAYFLIPMAIFILYENLPGVLG